MYQMYGEAPQMILDPKLLDVVCCVDGIRWHHLVAKGGAKHFNAPELLSFAHVSICDSTV